MEELQEAFAETLDTLEKCGVTFASPELADKYRLERLTLYKHGNYVQIFELKVTEQNQGYGSSLMENLTAIADAKGWTLTLTPDTSLGATSIGRLKKFYHRFGFRDNKGRDTDFTVYDSMIRKPKSNNQK